jgi:hypothetical protein
LKKRTALFAVAMTLWSGNGRASDGANLCVLNLNPSSANISLPADDSNHYPDQWTGAPDKVNLKDAANGMEWTYKVWHWVAAPKGGGRPVKIDGLQGYAAIYMPSPFENGALGWVRLFLAGLVGPDGKYHHYVYVAPGEFAPRQAGYDYALGGPGELTVLEATEAGMVPLPDPTRFIGQSLGSGGNQETVDFVSTDEFIEVHTMEESIKRASYPFVDGRDPLFNFYWQRPYMISRGTVRYAGVDYDVVGMAWEEREWKVSIAEIRSLYQWRWTSIQIKGCLDERDREVPCEHSLRTIAAWDNRFKADGSPAFHYWSEVGPPPHCAGNDLSQPDEWSLVPTEYWVSPHTGIKFARAMRLTAPSREVDLTIEGVVADEEMYKTAALLPGLWDGPAKVSGTIQGKRVFGDAAVEQFNTPLLGW